MQARSTSRCSSGFYLLMSLPLAAPSFAMADTLVFSPTSGIALPGQSVSFNVALDASEPFYGFSMYLDASAANAFNVTGQTSLNGNPITDPNFVGSFPTLIPTTGNSADLGYTSTGINDIAAGSYSIESLTISVGANVPPGIYTLATTTGVTGSEYNDAEGDEYDLPASSYTIYVPEPSTAALLGVVTLALFPVRRPSRRRD